MPRIFENKPEVVSAFELNHVYDFDRWLDEQGSHLYNAYVKRDGVDAPHSFLFKRRHDLTAHTGRAEMSQDPPSGRFDIAWRRFGKGESVGGKLSCADNNIFIAAPPPLLSLPCRGERAGARWRPSRRSWRSALRLGRVLHHQTLDAFAHWRCSCPRGAPQSPRADGPPGADIIQAEGKSHDVSPTRRPAGSGGPLGKHDGGLGARLFVLSRSQVAARTG